MDKYLFMPEHARWYVVEASSAEAVARSQLCWYGSGQRVGVFNCRTGEIEFYMQDPDSGEIVEIEDLEGICDAQKKKIF